ncbi:MAG: 16S rRNA (adenine(1518)-N(6)/adenine(1519)-N(6))-dimethyltransferase RsmA [Ignavibacterium album]|uniref:16S rRNA (adenine(1518)-N(6)/adenine(1519)-N(6))- dimethyltransferase RsmA n=1 Tax=Ignavibacterium album TaxID=591197 RepID=UPI0026E9CCD8|nr:16S rRNA (adenine(1518)-N(6)/adenine(1519)-N(6))-dimethyltransferase RsmA [Ignavibacterium album]MCX8105883.1 16S rRNA (adenine(1518)-N(6)/adenine(1519)-N(6))-dimethyltransferase RsmA [Ignavibacterium album]
MVKPLKRLGQNFLKDKNILRKIYEFINPQEGERIIEIGPGEGALTEFLISSRAEVIAIEIDKRVIEHLQSSFPDIKIINQDFLEVDLTQFHSSDLRIVGNIPYNITSPIIFKLIENHNLIRDAIFMVQYEVAKRITAKKGSKDYGILSVLLSYFAETELCFKVSPNVFYPKPKVFSAVVKIKFKKNIDESLKKTFIQIVKAAFGNRRKTLKNSLSNSIFAQLNFSGCEVDLSLRAEQLDLSDFIKLAEFARENFSDQINQD